MTRSKLSTFFQGVSNWPANPSELKASAIRLGQLLGAPVVAIQKSKNGDGLAWAFEDPLVRVDPDEAEEVFARKLSRAKEGFMDQSMPWPVAKTFKLDGEPLPWRINPSPSFLTVVNLSGAGRGQGAQKGAPAKRNDYGWLMVMTAKPLSPLEEELCLAAAQRFSALADAAFLESEIQLRNQFLSIASHELKTPLTSIYGVLQLQERIMRVQRNSPPDVARERTESYLKMAIRQTQRLNELIDALLDVSRIQNGRFFAEPSDVDVAVLVRESINGRLSVIAQEMGVRLSLDAPEELRAWVDPVRLEEVITNLTMNAIRFSPEGGVVWIRLRGEGELLKLVVRDQGPPVPLEDRERIFQPFERAQRTARFGGLGLGLFISRQIAQLHGGNVVLSESEPGKGNVFEATFPLKPRQALSAVG